MGITNDRQARRALSSSLRLATAKTARSPFRPPLPQHHQRSDVRPLPFLLGYQVLSESAVGFHLLLNENFWTKTKGLPRLESRIPLPTDEGRTEHVWR